jgi:phage terminase small subunit
MNDDANVAAAAAAQLEQQLALFTTDNAAVETYCSSVSTYTRQLAEFEAEVQAQLPLMQRLLSDLDAVLLLVLQGSQNMEIISSSDTAVHLATEAAADCSCSAGLSSQAAILHMLQGGTISVQQYESHRTPSTKFDMSCRYLGCVRVLARRKFQAKFILSAGGRRQAGQAAPL